MKYLIKYGGNIKSAEKWLEDTFTKVLRTKKISKFHTIAVVDTAFIEGQELIWFCNSRPVKEKLSLQEPSGGRKPYYPKKTLLWGDYKDKCNPYLIAIPFTEITWDQAMECINSGLDSFLRNTTQPEWTKLEERAFLKKEGRWSLHNEIQFGLELLGKKKECQAATAGKGGKEFEAAYAPYRAAALEAVKHLKP